MAGYGIMPMGLGIYGLYTPAASATVPDGNTTGVRWLNPATGDYEIDGTTGHLKQQSRVLQQVILAMITEFGSATGETRFGYSGPRKMGTNFTADVTARTNRALRHLTNTQQAMRIDDLTVERGSGRYAINLRFTNLETGDSEEIQVTGNG